MKKYFLLIAITALSACQTTQTTQTPKKNVTISFNDEGKYVLSNTKKGDVTLPFCYIKDENGKIIEGEGGSEYTVDELATIVQFGCTPRDKNEAMEKFKKAKALEKK